MKTLYSRIFLFLLFIGSSGFVSAQEPLYQVSGCIKNDKETLPYANVALLEKDSTMAASAATDGSGLFRMKVPAGQYILRASFMGYDSVDKPVSVTGDTDLGNVVLGQSENMLSDVVVTARLTERKGDRMVINLAGSPLAVGKTTKDILKYAPGVWVDPRGSISINGNSSVRVMINDRDVRMSGDELMNYLETLKAEDILKIEVIPVAGAEYEANSSGGIIHITLKKQALEGVNGSVAMAYAQGKYPTLAPSANVNYKRDKWSFTGRYNYRYRKSFMDTAEDTEFYDTDTRQQSSSYYKMPRNTHYGDFGAVYDINDRSEVGVEVEYFNAHENNNSFNATAMQAPTGNTRVDGTVGQRENESNIYATFYYKIKTDTLGSDFKVIADIMRNQSDSYMHSDAVYENEQGEDYYRNNYIQTIPAKTTVYTVRADFEKKTKTAISYALGAKYANSSINSDSYYLVNDGGSWRDDASRSNQFRYHEEVWAGYGRMSARLWGNNISLGLRAENTSLTSRSLTLNTDDSQSYFDFFPSVSLQRPFGKDNKHSLSVNYSRRISRPYYGIFNPYTLPLSEFSSVVGNPYIKPSYVSRYGVTGVFFSKYSIDLGYTHISDAINQVILQDPNDPDQTIYKHVNIGSADQLSLSFSAPVEIVKWWGLNLNANARYYIQKFEGQRDEKFSWMGSLQNNFKFGKGWSADLSGFYQSAQIQGNMRIKGVFSTYASIVKKALDNRLIVSLSANDLFNTMKIKVNASGAGYHKYVTNRENWRSVSLSVRWNFSAGKKDLKIKKVETGSQDERGRL